mgnify:FL=1
MSKRIEHIKYLETKLEYLDYSTKQHEIENEFFHDKNDDIKILVILKNMTNERYMKDFYHRSGIKNYGYEGIGNNFLEDWSSYGWRLTSDIVREKIESQIEKMTSDILNKKHLIG